MNRQLIILGIVGILLLIPLIAMQFTNEVDWSLSDFVIMGVLLLGTGFLIEMLLRFVKSKKQRLIGSALILLLFFIIWAELAVGIFETPFAGS